MLVFCAAFRTTSSVGYLCKLVEANEMAVTSA
ncbi:hypothetical protein BAAA27536_07125 [Bifidobacterium animalis subsp. lactis ATCC 27536]|nr:hypothetical protein BAAA27536_07125 [Bifidobacterium animalis subsp. lactis ATCC 27536]KOA44936.1 hypothetical protein BAAA27673_07225 [Bifidobacterium animalis subsp. lactis ATCC 27673]KOA49430.1 hypothetical protein BAAA27674_07335 [Bifidobacterium animalis subsp. lactis ATCC 27674]